MKAIKTLATRMTGLRGISPMTGLRQLSTSRPVMPTYRTEEELKELKEGVLG